MELSAFSDKQLAGQRLMVGFSGTRISEELKSLIKHLKVGGLILFSENLKTPQQIEQLCSEAQQYAHSCGQPPLFIAIDQEGGQVARLKSPFTRFDGNPSMKDEHDAVHFAEVTAAEMAGVGINMNMAPVVDVAPEEINSIMAGRVFGSDPHWVSRLGVAVIEHLQQNRIIAVAKHFPGIGRTILDSHKDLPVCDVDLRSLEQFDLIPFKAAIACSVAAVMLSHIAYPQLDSQWPASLSTQIARDLLRRRFGFDGLVLTDDLDMGAIVQHYDIRTVISRVLEADIDMALICHPGPNIEIAFEKILETLREAPELKARSVKSVQRIMRIKNDYLLR
jgi:beta-N-acetylhexosaminidase